MAEVSPGDCGAKNCTEDDKTSAPRQARLRSKQRQHAEQKQQSRGAGRHPQAQRGSSEFGINAKHQPTPVPTKRYLVEKKYVPEPPATPAPSVLETFKSSSTHAV